MWSRPRWMICTPCLCHSQGILNVGNPTLFWRPVTKPAKLCSWGGVYDTGQLINLSSSLEGDMSFSQGCTLGKIICNKGHQCLFKRFAEIWVVLDLVISWGYNQVVTLGCSTGRLDWTRRICFPSHASGCWLSSLLVFTRSFSSLPQGPLHRTDWLLIIKEASLAERVSKSEPKIAATIFITTVFVSLGKCIKFECWKSWFSYENILMFG